MCKVRFRTHCSGEGLRGWAGPDSRLEVEVNTAWFGDRTARKRGVLVVRSDGMPLGPGVLEAIRQSEVAAPECLGPALLPPDALLAAMSPEAMSGAACLSRKN